MECHRLRRLQSLSVLGRAKRVPKGEYPIRSMSGITGNAEPGRLPIWRACRGVAF